MILVASLLGLLLIGLFLDGAIRSTSRAFHEVNAASGDDPALLDVLGGELNLLAVGAANAVFFEIGNVDGDRHT